MRIINRNHRLLRASQRGVALVMSMAFLLILTLIGVTAMSTSALEERMAGNMVDKNYALQAAESALLAGEQWIITQGTKPPFSPPLSNDGLHLPSTGQYPVWHETTGVWAGTDIINYVGLGKVKTQPKFIIEYMGKSSTGKGKSTGAGYGAASSPEIDIFRVTARGTGSSNDAATMVQSTYEILF